MRLDLYLVEIGLAPSRSKAQEWIRSGCVTVGGNVEQKCSFPIDDQVVEVTSVPYEFVGRGGVKLDSALDYCGVSPSGMVCADIGASTGGFTDCLLRRGAERVYAIDSGTGQLAASLVSDPRVVNLEKCNARYLDAAVLGTQCDLVVLDVSFISQTLILPAVTQILKPGGIYIGLIKPQFECGRKALDKRGIVRDPLFHEDAIKSVCDSAIAVGLSCRSLMRSVISGGDGNTEFLLFCTYETQPSVVSETLIKEVVRGFSYDEKNNPSPKCK